MSDKEEPLILQTQDARGLVTLTLNRPQAFNALSEAMLADLQREFDAIASDEFSGDEHFERLLAQDIS